MCFEPPTTHGALTCSRSSLQWKVQHLKIWGDFSAATYYYYFYLYYYCFYFDCKGWFTSGLSISSLEYCRLWANKYILPMQRYILTLSSTFSMETLNYGLTRGAACEMQVCMHAGVCVYIYVYVCKHACMYVCMYVCMFVFMCACMCACMYVCMHACMHACMYACMYVFKYACMYGRMYPCMHVCMHVGTHVCMREM